MLTDRLTWDEIKAARATVNRGSSIRKKRKEARTLRQMLEHGWVVVPIDCSGDGMTKLDSLHCDNLVRYHKIGNLNPYGGRLPDRTVYVLGSPGAGKTAFLEMLESELSGRVVIESGVWDLFRETVARYLISHGRIDSGFRIPFVDGLAYFDGKTLNMDHIVNGLYNLKFCDVDQARYFRLGYEGWDNNEIGHAYRLAIEHVRSGGKSAFPDRLFYKRDGYVGEVVSIPGHFSLMEVVINRSIPKFERPDSVIYLIDPLISGFEKANGKNVPLESCYIHLAEALRFEAEGIPVYWFLSKTTAESEQENREQAESVYNCNPKLVEIARRLPNLPFFDSFISRRGELAYVLDALHNGAKQLYH